MRARLRQVVVFDGGVAAAAAAFGGKVGSAGGLKLQC